MFGRKIPDKVMASEKPTNSTEETGMEKRASAERGPGAARNDTPARRVNSGAVETVLGQDSVFKGGKIVSKGTLRIDGQIEAEIEAEDSIVVGPTGVVRANITARSVAISGKVYGNINAQERLELQPTCEVHGDLQTATGALIVEGGAKLEGRCTMGLGEKQAGSPGQPEPPKKPGADSGSATPPPKQ
jgi:cytoskeletal protein CcmA (bactofilin family)